MTLRLLEKADDYYLNYCAKLLARGPVFGPQGSGPQGLGPNSEKNLSTVSEAWRFPLIDTGPDPDTNVVSFVWDEKRHPLPSGRTPSVIGTFHRLYEPIPLRRLVFEGTSTAYFAVTAVVPKGEIHRYRFVVDGDTRVDPINPQTVTTDDGAVWSRFFTENAHRPVSFQDWELRLLYRLTEQMLPFRTLDAQTFLERHYQSLSDGERQQLYRLDDSVGEVNFIDKLLAREERHHLVDYQICLRLIDQLLRRRNPFIEPSQMPREMFTELYDQMATGNVPGWNYGQYGSPRYFLELLRRHVVTGAFCHPKHGGNVGAAGWAYLSETLRGKSGEDLFAWREALEPPLGTNRDYRG